ncbi:hypothetical protein GCM10010149_88400 [Nonomuraea roseoviolacea subsp. roseoviolacea]|uniref:hypothetical protein n=1 Tax=Nonomuraea roseoviolacea TaxID=103837 RepID=UPI0031CDF9A5
MDKGLSPAMQDAYNRLEHDREIWSGKGVSLNTIKALQARGHRIDVEHSTVTETSGNGTAKKRAMWIARPARSVEITTVDEIVRTDDGDYERDENYNYGRTHTVTYDITAGEGFNVHDFGEMVTEVAEILTKAGMTEYSASNWFPYGWYSAEDYPHPYTGTWEKKSAHLYGFTQEESRAIHALVITPDHVKAAFIRVFTQEAKSALFYSETISLPEDESERANIDPQILAQDGHPFDSFYEPFNLTESARKEIAEDCENFVNEMWHTLYNLDAKQCGYDFIMSRNGHGCGYWEHDYGTKAQSERLHEATKPYGTLGLSLGDDGTVYTHN